jgi:hypothetical protein
VLPTAPLPWLALLIFCAGARAQTPTEAHPQLDTVTVEAARHRDLVEQQVKSFVSHISSHPYDTSMARWQNVAPLCPLVGGLPREDGEYILTRVSGRQQLAEIKTAMAEEIAPR